MSDWFQATLEDLCIDINDGDWIETKDQGGSDYRLLQVSNIGLGAFRETGKFRYVTAETYERLRCREIRPGMVLVARMPDPVGRAWFVTELAQPAITSVDVAILEPDETQLSPRYCMYLLNSPQQLAQRAAEASGTTRLRVTRKQLAATVLSIPDLPTQKRVESVLGSIDDLIESNRRRVEVLEEMARAIYREWFVHFRFPGHEDATFVDSDLGPIPEGWSVAEVETVGSSERWGITGGPFGSKLGRKDYVDSGVPVLRGANLSVGGGFDDSDLVYVTPEKADDLRSCWAVRGDVVITQRGTLGQIGLIPDSSTHEVYVLSQSQMKVTLDETKLTRIVFYEQMRSPEVTERFIARAMTSGVPHLNLGLLREFQVLVPESESQRRFGTAVEPLHDLQQNLREQGKHLAAVRDKLLPKLVTGQIDVSDLDLDAVVEKACV